MRRQIRKTDCGNHIIQLTLIMISMVLIGCGGGNGSESGASSERPAGIENSKLYGKYKVDLQIGSDAEETYILTIGDDPNRKGLDNYLYLPGGESLPTYRFKDQEISVAFTGNTVSVDREGIGWICDLVLQYSGESDMITISGKAASDNPLERQGMISGSAVRVDGPGDWIVGESTNTLGMTYVRIPAGEFTMGSPEDEAGRYTSEKQHPVRLTKNYYLQATEVTQGQWRTIMGYNPSRFSNCGDDCPVDSVSWNDIQDFLVNISAREGRRYRLPTEAEWEYAARAGSSAAFSDGDISHIGTGRDPKLAGIGWYAYNSGDMTQPVGQKMPNAWGLYDVHGNVREWCQDWKDDYPDGSVSDPMGPSSGLLRVLRGGDWSGRTVFCRSAYRSAGAPDERNEGNGFRTVLMFSPSATITKPTSGSEYGLNDVITFQGTAEDPEDGPLARTSLVWRSDIDGKIGTGASVKTSALSKGVHTITLTATDSDEETAVDTTTITISGYPETFTNTLGMTFTIVYAGTFTMGSPSDEPRRISNEIMHSVTLTQDYYLQKTEVTQGQWRALMGNNPSLFFKCGDNCPVESISWNDAQAFIAALNKLEGTDAYRLPTEAEWEYAARSGTTTAFATGDMTTQTSSGFDPNLDIIGWYAYNSGTSIQPVGLKKPNNWGLFDMHGNVMEWCQDWKGNYSPNPVTDPVGPATGTERVMRGGRAMGAAWYCRSASRLSNKPDRRNEIVGLRLVLVPVQ